MELPGTSLHRRGFQMRSASLHCDSAGLSNGSLMSSARSAIRARCGTLQRFCVTAISADVWLWVGVDPVAADVHVEIAGNPADIRLAATQRGHRHARQRVKE